MDHVKVPQKAKFVTIQEAGIILKRYFQWMYLSFSSKSLCTGKVEAAVSLGSDWLEDLWIHTGTQVAQLKSAISDGL